MLNQTPYSLRGSLALCGVAERDSNNDWGFKLLAYPRFGLSTYRPVFQRVVETAHPYADNSNLSWELNFPGALDVVVEFDGNSRTESNYDYVFFRIGGLCVSARYCGGDCLQRAAYCGVCVCVCVCVCVSLAGSNDANRAGVEKYTGGRGGSARNFPGVDGSAPLVIPHSAFTVRFVSDGR